MLNSPPGRKHSCRAFRIASAWFVKLPMYGIALMARCTSVAVEYLKERKRAIDNNQEKGKPIRNEQNTE